MPIRKQTFYSVISLSCFLGYVWVYLNYAQTTIMEGSTTVCFLKNITGLPCPSCGSTRAIIDLLYGNFQHALFINPLGYLLAFSLLFLPFWMLMDLGLKRNTLYFTFIKSESILRKRWVAFFSISILSANWIWTIYKHL